MCSRVFISVLVIKVHLFTAVLKLYDWNQFGGVRDTIIELILLFVSSVCVSTLHDAVFVIQRSKPDMVCVHAFSVCGL